MILARLKFAMKSILVSKISESSGQAPRVGLSDNLCVWKSSNVGRAGEFENLRVDVNFS